MFYKIFKITEVNYELSKNANEIKTDWINKHPDANETEILRKALELNIPRTEPERIIR